MREARAPALDITERGSFPLQRRERGKGKKINSAMNRCFPSATMTASYPSPVSL